MHRLQQTGARSADGRQVSRQVPGQHCAHRFKQTGARSANRHSGGEKTDVEDRPEATHEVDNDNEDGWDGAVNRQI